jgi:drug/metabolite transporter (DMT)-like permease
MSELKKAYWALGVVCIVWGTTYLFIRIGVETFPPLLFSGIRHGSAGLLIFGYLFVTGKLRKIDSKNFMRQAIPGVMMIAMGNGVIGWCERYIPSSLAALILSIMPVYVVGINYLTGIEKKPPHWKVLFGLALGCIGVGLIFKDNVRDLANPDYLIGVVVAFLACLSWAAGSVFIKYKPTSLSPIENAAIQLTSGGITLILGGFLFDDFQEFESVSSASIYSLIYLIFIGSLLSYICFMYALAKLPVGLASIYAYINPFIALLLGSLVLNETISWTMGLALFTTLAGVWYINKGYAVSNDVR